MTQNEIRTPGWFSGISHTLSFVFFVLLVVMAVIDPKGFQSLILAKDSLGGTGIIEHLTVIVLIPGILAGGYAIVRLRHAFPSRLHLYWLGIWTLACLYFAGEEISWGQWFFQWDTPETIASLNDQQETNLHNMSSWLDQKPRLMVELFIFFAGFIAPLLSIKKKDRSGHWFWIIAPASCLSAAALFVFVRGASWVDGETMALLGDSELREFTVAWFLALYLMSYPLRLMDQTKGHPY